MSDRPPIPEPLWQRLREFLDAGRTGQITLNVGHGVVTSAEFRERVEAGRRGVVAVPGAAQGHP
jgi:hypothetical protein